jgi:hypothetical protein
MASGNTNMKKLMAKAKDFNMRTQRGEYKPRSLRADNGDVNLGSKLEADVAEKLAARAEKACEAGKAAPVTRTDPFLEARVKDVTTRPLPRPYARPCAVVESNRTPRNRAERRHAQFALAQAGWI